MTEDRGWDRGWSTGGDGQKIEDNRLWLILERLGSLPLRNFGCQIGRFTFIIHNFYMP